MFSVDPNPCSLSAPLNPHQSHLAISGEWAGSDRATKLAVLGGDGQLPAQHRPAAEVSHRTGQAGQLLLPRGCCHASENPS